MTTSTDLLEEIKAAAASMGLTTNTLCYYAVRNTYVVKRLEEGRSVTLATAEKIRDYIRDHNPPSGDSQP